MSDLSTLFIAPEIQNPCSPTPCGSNSQCRNINGQAVCSCIQGFHGSPPTCRPECSINSDCLPQRACVNQKCIDPCPGSCAFNAFCKVINHNAVCVCPSQYTGDPFSRCIKIGILILIYKNQKWKQLLSKSYSLYK